ncbi:hypothetical protein K501DRAFT_335006 [Backusella circina FSU 941]|nr:hypothetical protein K501DRAFT_335006 [Backusella circina FSU 941]
MSSLDSSLLPLYRSGECERSSHCASNPDLFMPANFQLFDISEDNKFLALIDDNSMLQAYEISNFEDKVMIKRQTLKDIPCKPNCNNSIYVYISVASETGYVAVSFLQMTKKGMIIKKSSSVDGHMEFKVYRKNDSEDEEGQKDEKDEDEDKDEETLDKRFTNCRVYRGDENEVLEIPFQGRAVFTKDRLILFDRWILDVYDAKTFKKMYFFKLEGSYLEDDGNLCIYDYDQDHNWCKKYQLDCRSTQYADEGYGMANMSAHIRKNVVVKYKGDFDSQPSSPVKIWSTLNGSLICSFMREYGEHVICISDDHRFLVTKKWASLNIYCMNSGTHLHTYEPKSPKDNSRKTTIIFVKLMAHQNYMLILGTTAKQAEEQGEGIKIVGDGEEEPFTFGTSSNNNRKILNSHGSTSDSTLIYTKAYYGINYKQFSTSKGSQKLMIEDLNENCKPFIYFTGDAGRILVYVQFNGRNRIIDEIILPLPELNSKISSDSTYLGAHGVYNNTKVVPKDYFNGIESCLLALLYRYYSVSDDSQIWRIPFYEPKEKYVLKKTKNLLQSIISPIDTTTYFQTMSASKILMNLAHFDEGLEIILDLILEKEFRIAIYNDPVDENRNGNILTVLIQNNKLDLFQILFNQTILDYYNGSPINLFPLMDVLLYLQKNQLPELLLKCIGNLSYLPIDLTKAGLQKWEFNTLGDQKSFNNFTTTHQMKKRHSGIVSFYLDKITKLISLRKTKVKGTDIDYPEIYFNFYGVCFIPIPTPDIYDAIAYAISTKNSPYSSSFGLREKITQEVPIIEVLLTHRWRNYVKGPFYIILFIQILFYIFYTVSISFPEEIFSYIPGSPIQDPGHLVCLVIAFLTWILLSLQEAKQMITLQWEYWKSPYNYVDILACIFPLVSSILLFIDGPHLYDISSFTTLVLWIHFLLRLRVNRRMGILIEIIIQMSVKITPIIGLMILLIIAFTHSFVVLLRRQDDGFFQEQYGGNVAPFNESTLGSVIALSDQSQQNLFKDVFLAFSTVWLFLYGIFDPILSGDVGNYPMALVLAILFSFITALVILNVVIALMTGAIDETKKEGNRNWHIHLADVSNEVENLLPWLVKKDSAKYVYYHSSRNDVELQHEKIESETKKLKEKLLKRREREKYV